MSREIGALSWVVTFYMGITKTHIISHITNIKEDQSVKLGRNILHGYNKNPYYLEVASNF